MELSKLFFFFGGKIRISDSCFMRLLWSLVVIMLITSISNYIQRLIIITNLGIIRYIDQCYGLCSILAGTDGISRTSM